MSAYGEDNRSIEKSNSRSSYHERSRTRALDRRREKDQNGRERDLKDRVFRGDRERKKHGFYERNPNRDSWRRHDYDREEERPHKHSSPSQSRDRSSNLSSPCSPSHNSSHTRGKRVSGFDMAPPTMEMSTAPVPVQLAGAPQALPGPAQNMLTSATLQFGTAQIFPAQAMTQLATRHARRVYVGGLPPLANELTIAAFFSHVMVTIGGNSAGPGDAVVNVYLNHEKKFAFVEMRTVEEASNAMALDGIIFEGVAVRVRRPTDYNPALAAVLGPGQPNPHLNLAAVGLVAGATSGLEGPDRIFVGGIPYQFTEDQIRELLETFGTLRGFDLVKDRDTGNSKGYGFCIYQDPNVTDIACAALNGMKMGEKTLTVRRAALSGHSKSEQENILAHAQQQIAMQKMVLQAGVANLPMFGATPLADAGPASKVLCLTEAITDDLLRDDDEYEEILEDMKEECGKFGALVNVVIPRPKPDGVEVPGVGKVFLEYSDTAGSVNARNALSGRKFGGNVVNAFYYPEDKYYSVDYSA